MAKEPCNHAEWGRIGALESWARTQDRAARTAPGRAAFLARFDHYPDPEAARKAHFARLREVSRIVDRAIKANDEQYLAVRGWPCPKVSTERRTARLLAGWGVAAPTLQHREGPYRIDFAWEALRIGLEVDGWHHDRPDQAERGWERHRYLIRRGWLLIHIDPDAENSADLLVNVARLIQHSEAR